MAVWYNLKRIEAFFGFIPIALRLFAAQICEKLEKLKNKAELKKNVFKLFAV